MRREESAIGGDGMHSNSPHPSPLYICHAGYVKNKIVLNLLHVHAVITHGILFIFDALEFTSLNFKIKATLGGELASLM